MLVKRIVANIATPDPAAARAFYGNVLGLEFAMDHGWIVTFAAPAVEARPQVSFLSEGGSGTPVPDLSVEVDDVDGMLARVTREHTYHLRGAQVDALFRAHAARERAAA